MPGEKVSEKGVRFIFRSTTNKPDTISCTVTASSTSASNGGGESSAAGLGTKGGVNMQEGVVQKVDNNPQNQTAASTDTRSGKSGGKTERVARESNTAGVDLTNDFDPTPDVSSVDVTRLPSSSEICNEGCAVVNGSGGLGLVILAGLSFEGGTTVLIDTETGLIHVFSYKGAGFGLGTPSVFLGLEKGVMSPTSLDDLTGFGYSANAIAAFNVGVTGQVAGSADAENLYRGNGTASGSVGGVVGYGGGVSGLFTLTQYQGSFEVNKAPKGITDLITRIDK